MRRYSGAFKAVFLFLLAPGLFLLALKAGSVPIGWADLFHWARSLLIAPGNPPDDPAFLIFFSIRLPRVLMAAMVGALLSSAGSALQALFRNPLADPYLLGISSGAALGAVLGIFFGILSPAPMACLGALVTLGLVLLFARLPSATSVSLMILAGAAVHSLVSAVLTLVLSLVSQRYESSSILFWLLGSLNTLSYRVLIPLMAASGLGLAALFFHAPALNLLAQGEDTAQSLGLNVERTKWILLLLSALLTGLAVTFNGMIPFVGLVVPHLVRLLFGQDHRKTLPLTALVGALLVMSADAVGRTALAPQEIPTGVITALAGAPFFLFVLRREKRKFL